jgi:glycyl-tRNA synthetase alpha subunit
VAGARVLPEVLAPVQHLDSSGSIGVTERTAYILRVRQLAIRIAKAYVGPEEMKPAEEL